MHTTPDPGTIQGNKTFSEFVFDIVIVTLLLYLMINQTFHAFRYSKRRISGISRAGYGFFTNFTLALSGLFAILSILFEIASYFVAYTSTTFNMSNLSIVIAFTLLYSVLWFRQRMFYVQEWMQHLTTPCSRFFSIFEGYIMLIFGLLTIVVTFQQVYHYQVKTTSEVPHLVFYIGVISQFQVQISLLLLFVFPLWKHTRVIEAAHAQSHVKLIKRAAILTSLAILVDVCITILLVIFGLGSLTSLSFLVNYIIIILCFKSWRSRLFLLCNTRKPSPASETEVE